MLLGRRILLGPAPPAANRPTLVPEVAPRPPSPEVVCDIADLLGEAWAVSRPVVLAGRGALASDAGAALRRLGELTGAVLATTLPAAGLFDGDDFNIGICGTFSTPVAAELIGRADCVLSFGAGLNPYTTYDYSLFPNARLIQIDIRAQELGRVMDPVIAVEADARLTAQALVGELERRDHSAIGLRTPENRTAISAYSPSSGVVDRSTPSLIDPNILVMELERILPRDRIICTGAGHHSRFNMRHLSFRGGRNFVWGVEFGTAGPGLGLAVGAQIARPDTPVAAFLGDGGLMMALGRPGDCRSARPAPAHRGAQ